MGGGRMKMRSLVKFLTCAALTTIAAVAAPAQDSDDQKPKKKPAVTVAAPAAATKAVVDDPDYIIGPEDALSINVWKEQELSHSVQVRPDGKVSLPLVP